jgi:hypothetical protein
MSYRGALGADTRPGEQRQALATLAQLCRHQGNLTAIADAGAILVAAGPGSAAELKKDAAATWGLCLNRHNKIY